MPQAVGVIQTIGFPPVLAAADAMVKAGAVTIVYYGLAERAEFLVAVRGNVSEVEIAVAAGIKAGAEAPGGIISSHYIVRNPPENVESVMDISFTEAVEEFRINL